MDRKNSTSKIFTIIKHEYLLKVRSKGFIISTLLGPILLAVFFGVIGLIAYLSVDSTAKKLAVLDKTEKLGKALVAQDTSKYFLTNLTEPELRERVLKEEFDGYLLISEDILKTGKSTVFTGGGGGYGYLTSVQSNLGSIVRKQRLLDAGADLKVIKLVEEGIDIQTEKITKKGTEKDYTVAYSVLGYILGFSIYMMMFIYGGIVMRGVIEEKANRIVEVLASSAKPFELMFGKVVGIGAVGLTQIVFWMILAGILLAAGGSIAQLFMGHNSMMPAGMNTGAPPIPGGFEIPHISPWLGIGYLFYFLSGYFIYSTLFAAVGSAVDQESDAQQLQLVVTLPIMIPIFSIQYLMSNPDGTFSVILSLIPFFSPILMMVRVASTNVPLWQIIASVVLILLTFWGCLIMTSKIYRIGILMYGKKPTFKDLYKWLRLS